MILTGYGSSQPKTRAEQAFHRVERALQRTLLAGKTQLEFHSVSHGEKGAEGEALRRLHAFAKVG